MCKMKTVRNYIDGVFADPDRAAYLDIENPSTKEVIRQVPLSQKGYVDFAESAAGWRFLSGRKRP